MKKRILVSVSYYIPHISGLTNAVANLAELLAENGYEVTVVTTQHERLLLQHEIIKKVHIERVPYLFAFHKGFILPNLPLRAYQQIKKVDQVVINLPQAEGFIIAILAKLLGKKIHCIYHCDLDLGEGFIATIITSMLKIANAICLSLATTVITSSDDFAQHSPVLITYSHKLQTIPLVIPIPLISKSAGEELAKRFLPKRKYNIGFIGRMAAEKGIEYLLEATPLLHEKLGNDFEIVLAGPAHVIGEAIYVKKIEKAVDANKGDIVQVGELKQNELGAFYSLLDVLVLPSVNTTEAFGMVQVEAMFCGTPVVASNLPGVRVPVQLTGMGKITEVGDSRKLAEAICDVLLQKKQYVQPKEKIAEIFSLRRIVRMYEKLFS